MSKESKILPQSLPSRKDQGWDRIAFVLSLGAAIIVIINYLQTRRDHKIQREILKLNLAKFKVEAASNPEMQKIISELDL